MSPAELAAARFIRICDAGFRAPEHHANWLAKHQQEIAALPTLLAKAVLAAHENATHVSFSNPKKAPLAAGGE